MIVDTKFKPNPVDTVKLQQNDRTWKMVRQIYKILGMLLDNIVEAHKQIGHTMMSDCYCPWMQLKSHNCVLVPSFEIRGGEQG